MIDYNSITIKDIINELSRLKEENPTDKNYRFVDLNEGASLESIMKLKKRRQYTLPQDYKEFLKFANGGEEFYRLYFNSLRELKRYHVYETVEVDGKEIEKTYLNVYEIASENGNPILLNLDNGEIYDSFHENGATKVIAKSFKEFLYRMLEGTKSKDAEGEDKAIYWLLDDFKPYREFLNAEPA